MNWLIVGGVVLVLLVFAFFKFRDTRHKLTFFIVIILLAFLIISIFEVSRSINANINTLSGVTQVGKVYFSWLGNLFTNAKTIGGYAIKQNWGVNSTVNSTT